MRSVRNRTIASGAGYSEVRFKGLLAIIGSRSISCASTPLWCDKADQFRDEADCPAIYAIVRDHIRDFAPGVSYHRHQKPYIVETYAKAVQLEPPLTRLPPDDSHLGSFGNAASGTSGAESLLGTHTHALVFASGRQISSATLFPLLHWGGWLLFGAVPFAWTV